MKTRLVLILIAFALFFSFTSCVKDNFNFDKWDRQVEYDASFAGPVVWGDVAFSDAVEIYDSTGLLIENEEGYVSLQYLTRVSSNKVNDIIYMDDQNIDGTINSPVFDFTGFDSTGDTVSFEYTDDMVFAMFNPDAEIDSVTLKTGLMNLVTTSSYLHAAKLYVTFPSVVKNGTPLSTTFIYTPGGGTATSLNNDLSGYYVDMTQTATGFNEIPVEVRLTLFWSGTSDNTGSVSFEADMYDMQYEIMHGYFGENTLFFESDTISISLFRNDDWNIEDYLFMDPKLKIYYWNSYGVPSQFYFTHLIANSAENESDYNIIDYGVGLPIGESNPYDVNYATVVGEEKLDSLKLNRDNSNIADVVNTRPRWIQFRAKATTNPAGNDHNNFVVEDSEIDVEVVMELPMWGYIYNWNMWDTTEVDLSDLQGDYNPVERVLVRVDIQNGFPIETFGQVYFTDENYVILDSLFYTNEEILLSAADCDANGRVLDFSRKITEIEYVDERLEKLETCKYVIYGGHANTTDAGDAEVVKIYSDYRIIFDIGFEVDLELEGDLDSIQNEFD